MAEQKLGPNQKKWVEALRSGKYKQGPGYLLRGECFCCLGVAVDIIDSSCDIEGRTSLEGLSEIVEAYALRSHNGRTVGDFSGDWGDCLAAANDSGATFEEIADFIEANPSAVFSESK